MSSSVTFRGPDRKRAIILLASSCTDPGHFLFDPKGALTGKSTSGLAPGRKEPCGRCEKGVVLDRFKRESKCPACDGKGWHWGDSGVPGVAVQTSETKAAPTKAAKTRKCLECDGGGALPNGRRCRNCRGEGRITVDAFVIADTSRVELDPLDRYEKAITKRNQQGDYERFELLETELRHHSRHLAVPFRRVFMQVPPVPVECLTVAERGYVGRAFKFFLEWMPKEIRVPKWVVDADTAARNQPVAKGKYSRPADREARDAEIIRRFDRGNGEDVKSLAEWAGLSASQVGRIVYAEREVA